MTPTNKIELRQLQEDYEGFLKKGFGIMKAAYFAASGHGFTNLINLSRDGVMLSRETDNNFVVVSYPLNDVTIKETITQPMRIVSFHTDETILKKN
jgi:hypothetical protein